MHNIHFPTRGAFHDTLKQRVEQYFTERGLSTTGDWRLFVKTGLILTWLVGSYVFLVFFATSLLMAILATVALAQGFILVSFNLVHDGAHDSYSRSKTVNWLMGSMLDVIGGSQMLWRQKHNLLHHTYTNINALDDDLHTGGLLRFSPDQPWRPWHRFQHLYAFIVYSFLTLSWVTVSDFSKLFSGRIGAYTLRQPTGSELCGFFLAKIGYFGYALILPCYVHPWQHVLIAFLAVHLMLGLMLSLVFQLAHTSESNGFPNPDADTGMMPNGWAVHQVETTANFAPTNPWVTWYVGGLNFQIEHHLFTRICHIHYPAISAMVAQTCREFSLPYVSYPTVRSALAGHYRFLQIMGQTCHRETHITSQTKESE